MPAVFAIPQGPGVELTLAPRLESWNRRDDPAQVALREFVAHVHDLIDPLIHMLDGPLAFHLHVAVPEQFDPLWERDLDNYLFPIARTLPEPVVTVWGTKGRGERSTVHLERAAPATLSPPVFHVPRASTSEAGWKAAVQQVVETADELPEGPVALQLAFTVGSEVNWPGMWKPSIDALSPLLGRTSPDRDWNPLDGRIVRLGLHKSVDPTYGREASLEVHGTAADASWPELAWLTSMTADQRWAFLEQHRGKMRVRAEHGVFSPRPGERQRIRVPREANVGLADLLVFRDDDDSYLAWIAANPPGFVLNIQRSLNPNTARVHRADCRTIAADPTGTTVWTGPYIKLCATDLHELDRWAADSLGTSLTRCGTCLPAAA